MSTGTKTGEGSGDGGSAGSVAGAIVNDATLQVNRSDAFTLGNVISGSGGLVHAGTGTTTLSVENSYSGATTITGGMLSISQDRNLGTAPGTATPGSIVIDGGALSPSTSFTLDARRGVALGSAAGSGTGTIDVAGGLTTLTYAGVIADNTGGPGSLVKTGAGTLALAGTSTYSGDTTVAAGLLQVTGSLASPNVAVSGGATLGGTGAVNATTVADLGGITPGTGVAGSGGIGALTLASLVFSGSGTITIGVQGGTTSSLLNVIGSVTTGTVANSVVFAFGNSLSSLDAGTYTLLSYGGAQLTDISAYGYSGNSGARQGVSLQSGTNALNLVVSNNAFPIWTGSTSTVWTGSDNWVLSGGGGPTSFLGNDTVVFNDSSNEGAVTLSQDVNPATTTFSGTTLAYTLSSPGGFGITTGNLVKSGPATLTISTSNSFSGGTTLSAGTIRIGNDAAFGTGDVAVTGSASGITLSSDGGDPRTVANTLQLATGVTLGDATNSGTLTFTGTVNLNAGTPTITVLSDATLSGLVTSGGFTKAGPAVLTITGNNNYAGGTTLAAGTLLVGGNSALGVGGVTLAGGVLASDSTAARTLANAFTITGGVTLGDAVNSGALTLGGANGISLNGATQQVTTPSNVTFAGAVTNGGLAKAGAGTLTLSASNSYALGTTLSAGAIFLGNVGALGGGTLTVSGNATVRTALTGTVTNAMVLDPSVTGTFEVQSGSAVFSGVVSGSGGLVKSGAGTVGLAGNNTFTGGVTLSAGQLNLNGASALGTGGLTVAGVSTIDNTSGGAITLANNVQAWNADFSFAGTNPLNLGTGAVTLGGNRQVTVTSNTLTVGGAIGGGFALTKAGAGTLALTGSSGYTGGTTLTAGTLLVGHAAALGSGTVSLNGGTLNVNGVTAANDVVLGGGVVDGNGGTLSGVISGASALTKSGPGTLTLTGSNTYSGGTVISGGTLAFDYSDALTYGGTISGAGSFTKLGPGTLTLTAANTLTGTTTIATGTLELGAGGNLAGPIANAATLAFNRSDAFTVGSVISGAGVVRQVGSGTTTLSAANSYSGGTVISAGAIAVSAANNLGGGTAATSFSNGGRLIVTTGFTSNRPFSIGTGGGTLEVASGQTYTNSASSPIQTSGTLTKEGVGGLTFSGYGAGAGSFNSSSLKVVAGAVRFDTGRFNNNIGLSSITIGSGAAAIVNAAHALGGYNATTPTIILNGGTFTLGAEQYLSTMTLNGGTINGTNEVRTDGNFQATASTGTTFWSARLSTVNSAAAFTVASGAEVRISGNITSGGGALAKAGPGLLVVSGSNTYSVGTTISGGILEATSVADAGGPGSIGTGGLTLAGGTFRYAATGSGTTARTVTNSAADGGIEVTNAAAVLALTGAFSGTATRTLTKSGSGTLVYAGASTIPNVVAITGGTFQVGNGGTAGAISGNVTNAGTLVFNRSNDVTYAGSISGTGALAKLGANTLTLSGSSDFSGGTQFTAGTISFAAGALGTGTVAMRGGTLQWATGNTQDISPQLGLVAGTAATLDTNGNDVTLAGGFGGGTSGSLVKTGGGSLALTGSNDFTGGTTLSGGTLAFADGGLGSAGNVTLAASTVLQWMAGNTQDPSSRLVLPGTGNVTLDTGTNAVTFANGFGAGASADLTKAGAGTLTLAGSNGYTGWTTVSAGTLALSGSGSIASSGVVDMLANTGFDISGADGDRTIGSLQGDVNTAIVLGGNTLTVNDGGNSAWFQGVMSGSGGFRKAGGGQLRLTGSQSFTGTATVEAGTLVLTVGNELEKAAVIAVLATGILDTPGITVVINQKLAGYGTVSGPVTFASGGILSPGGSVGTLTNDGSTTWNSATRYDFEVNDALGTAGTSPGWDLYNVTGDLTLVASEGDPIIINLTSLSGTSPGLADNFDAASDNQWLIADAGNEITTFDSSWFRVDTANFLNLPGNPDRFSVVRGDTLFGPGINTDQLYVKYTAIPEPATLVLAGIGLAAVGLAASRRRRRTR